MAKDCSYYLAYIRYTQKRYDEALKDFLPLQDDPKYKELVPYYIAEIYAIKKNYDKAQIVAQNYLSAYPNNEHAAEMYRILGDAYYHFGQYHQAVEAFTGYLDRDHSAPRRDALYMLGLSYYQTKVYSKAAEMLGQVTTANDALTQNAYLHMGLSYLQLAEKNKARMAFEQAAASNANLQIKEQAAYNYALCLHETSYSAFGESVTAFEKFLNEFPTSPYAEKVSNYLVEVYMNTRQLRSCFKVNRTDRQAECTDHGSQTKDSLPTGYTVICQCQFRTGSPISEPVHRHRAVQPPDKGGRLLLVRRILLPPQPDDGSRPRFQRLSATDHAAQ